MWFLKTTRTPKRHLASFGSEVPDPSAQNAEAGVPGVDSLSIPFSHRSFQKPTLHFPGVFGGFLEGSLERLGKSPLEVSEGSQKERRNPHDFAGAFFRF